MPKSYPVSARAAACLLSIAVYLPQEASGFRYRTPEQKDSLVVKAQTYLAHEDFAEALKCFGKLTQVEPKNFRGYLGIADCLYFQGDYLKAMEAANTALLLNAKAGDAYRRRGKINLKMHQDDAAIEDFTKALANSPDDPLYLSDRADAYYKKGELTKALGDLNKYLTIVKKPNPMIIYTRSIIYTKLGKKAEAEADRKRGDRIINGEY